MNIKEIESILLEIGFEKRTDHHNEPGYYYEFYQNYPNTDSDQRSHLWVGFEDYNNIFYVLFNCHNFGHSVDIKEMKSKEDFLKNLDYAVINSKDAWIYSDRIYYYLGEAADEQRKRYFDKRMEMNSKPCKEIIEHINEYGTEHYKTAIELEYEGKKIAEMSWEDLANIVIKKVINN